MVLQGQSVEGESLADILFYPLTEFRVFYLPAFQPWRQVFLRLGQISAVVEPAQFLQAVIQSLSGQMIQGVSQKVNIAALPDRLRDHCGNGSLESRMIIRGHELHAP